MILEISSAGERFGAVLAVREAGAFRLRKARFAPSLPMPAHRHPGPYFAFVAAGGIEERTPRAHRHHTAGTVHFHPSGDPHSGRTGPSGLECMSLVPHGRLALRLDALPARDAADPWLDALASRCHAEFGALDTASDLALEGLCLELTAALLRAGGDGRGRPSWLEDVREFLHAHLDRRVGLAEVAAVAGVHETHLARAFRRHVGCSPGGYVRRLRIERARRALTETETPLVEVALAAGFCSQSHFTRVFHRLVGTTPAAYRRRHGPGAS